jgi:hypothetical protein
VDVNLPFRLGVHRAVAARFVSEIVKMLSKARAWIEDTTRYVMSVVRQEGSTRSMAGGSLDASRDRGGDERLVANLIKSSPPVPLLKDEGPVSDRFGSGDIAKRLADIIETTDPPFTISLSGAWGVGKTTLAKQLKDELGRRSTGAQRIRVVEVDLWTEDLANLRRRLALEVAVELQGVSPDKRDKRLKEQAEAFDKELRRSVQRQERPQVTVPLLKAHPWWAVALLALIFAGLWALWNVTIPSDPTIDAVGAKAVVTILTALGIWGLIQSGLVLSVSSDASSTPPIEEKVGLFRRRPLPNPLRTLQEPVRAPPLSCEALRGHSRGRHRDREGPLGRFRAPDERTSPATTESGRA